MKTKAVILEWAREKGWVKSSDVVKRLKISRQTAAQHLRELASQKKLLRLGTTIDSRYILFDRRKAGSLQSEGIKIRRPLKGLSEDAVCGELAVACNLKKKLSPQSFSIFSYAFNEMLNNAIDHSKSRFADVELKVAGGVLEFQVQDTGIGAYESVRKRFRFHSHFEALEHLMKGKQTTAPEAHTGQGIFFTSRIADYFSLSSRNIRWVVDNAHHDQTVENIPPIQGTCVRFVLKARSRKDLKKIFDEYSNEAYEFDKTSVTVKLLRKKGDYVSRSEARRVLFGLEKFKRIVFDFESVPTIGQGFADEIFRIFANRYPLIQLRAEGMNEAVKFMVERSRRETLQ